jgi:hypothetical protein
LIFENLKNRYGNTIYQKNHLIYEISSYNLKVATTKFSWKFTMFQESFYRFKALKKNMWTSRFLFQKSFFLIKCSPNHFNFFVNFNIFHKKWSMCSKNSKKNKNIYLFRFWYSNILKHNYSFEFVIIVQSKVINLIIM